MNPYGVDTSEANTLGPLLSLKILYDQMPKTTGCSDCSKINGEDDKDWCCKKNSPSMYYCEFLKVFQEFQRWSKAKRTQIILSAIRNYLSNSLSKGCIFYQGGCSVYSERPYSCRIYSVIPKENWDKRWEDLKERQGEKFEARPQCNLVSADREITAQMDNQWFEHTKKCEERLGVPASAIKAHDFANGSYRTFHDHLLIELFPDKVLSHLSTIRLTNPTEEEIQSTVNTMREILERGDGI